MILITGASSGIGEAVARRFAQTDKELILIARRAEKLEKLQQELSKPNRKIHVFALDVREGEKIREWAKENETLLQKVNVLVNNAGLARGFVPFQESTPEQWKEMIDTNLTGVLNLTHVLLPHFLKNNDGHVLNLGSVAGRWAYPKGNIYCATKSAIHSFSENLRLDLLGKNIRVTEISPGLVETGFSEVRFDGDKEKAKKVYQGIQALSAEDIAEAVFWSASVPRHMNVQEMVLYPVAQASPTQVHRH